MKFIASSRVNNIFYGDIFKINNYGCLVFGSGKTQATRSASATNEDEVALDFACITRENDKVYGHFEMEIRAESVEDDPINERIKLDYFIRMLSAEETDHIYENSPLQIVEIAFDEFVLLSKFNITFVVSESVLPSPIKMQRAQVNPEKRMEHFKSLTRGAGIRTIIVPWMGDVTDKADLLKRFFNSNLI